MSLFMEIETDRKLPFDARKIAELVIETSLDYVKCPYETEVSLLLTTDEEIKEINRMQRQIDRATDVLSFPMLEYETPGDFSFVDEDAGLFHPDTGELMLGDIVISVDKVFEQAEEYGHSLLREYAFLIAHSMLHLFGYGDLSKEDIMNYLIEYGQLPNNFITKKEAKKLGWSGGSLEPYAPGKCIGGDYFGNYEKVLPVVSDRTYHECDIDTLNAKSRGAKRIIYSDDGQIYYTDNHYKSFTLLYGDDVQ